MTAAVLAIVAMSAVLLPAFFGLGRPRNYAWVGFLGVIAGAVMLIATPTPADFDPNGASQRWLLNAATGQDLSAALLATGVAGLLGAFAVGRSEPVEVTEQTDVD
jgi:uncharacterized membrane protein